eukprot:739478-Alexandrium_andersonii.AAC.1
MSASLVGSEMCIRDRSLVERLQHVSKSPEGRAITARGVKHTLRCVGCVMAVGCVGMDFGIWAGHEATAT